METLLENGDVHRMQEFTFKAVFAAGIPLEMSALDFCGSGYLTSVSSFLHSMLWAEIKFSGALETEEWVQVTLTLRFEWSQTLDCVSLIESQCDVVIAAIVASS